MIWAHDHLIFTNLWKSRALVMPEHHQTQITLYSNIVTDSCLQRLPVQCWLQYYDYNVTNGHLTNRQSLPYDVTGLNVMLTFQKETSHQKPFTEHDIWELYRKIAVWLTLENIIISQNYLLRLSHANYKLKTSNFQKVSNYSEHMAKVLWYSKVLEHNEAAGYVITCSILCLFDLLPYWCINWTNNAHLLGAFLTSMV